MGIPRRRRADVWLARTNDRDLVGEVTEFAFLGKYFFEGDLTAPSLRMAETPVVALRPTHHFPDQALAALAADPAARAVAGSRVAGHNAHLHWTRTN